MVWVGEISGENLPQELKLKILNYCTGPLTYTELEDKKAQTIFKEVYLPRSEIKKAQGITTSHINIQFNAEEINTGRVNMMMDKLKL